MKKSYKKGFILAETIAVSTVVIAALIIIYTQFISINNSYYRSFKYNSVNNLYSVDNIVSFLRTEDLSKLNDILEDEDYIDITSCSYEYFIEYPYCERLFEALKVKTVIYINDDINSIENKIKNNADYSQGLKTFVKSINYKQTTKHRLLVEFEDDTYATLTV